MTPARRAHPFGDQPFRGRTAVDGGLLTVDDLRGPRWRRILPGIHVAAGAVVDHELLVRAAAGLLLPHAVVSGASAGVLWGLHDLAGPTDPVELTVRPGAPRADCPAVRVRRRTLPRASVTQRSGVAVTTGRGCRGARAALDLADGLAGSPQETRLRLVIRFSGLPWPVAQHEVRIGGCFVARTDFAWPGRRLALEYEGAWHTRQVAADRRRIEALQAAGWRVLFVTAADLLRPAELIARIAAALSDS
ncbi:DUF559 domain-containing protein [Geodermatophilaceae bacterium NBWT11]|nr:DUF559 domain-containing protein [Geodermatophilaceae bacterium NBWT11]